MQCYLLPYYLAPSGEKIVMMCRKNIIGYKSGGRTSAQPILWNSAGQWVISGGRQNSREEAQEAAMREFFEETGVDFRNSTVQSSYQQPSNKINTATLTDGRSSFSVTYIQVQNLKSEALLREIESNISRKLVSDDELHEVTWIRLDAAKAEGFLGKPRVSEVSWMQAQIEEARKFPSIEQKLTARMGDASDWFAIALDHLTHPPS